MNVRILAIAFLFALLAAAPGRAGEDLVVLYPPDHTLATEDAIKIFAFRGEGEEPVPVTVNGKEADPLQGENFLAGEISLSPGINIVNVGDKMLMVYDLPDSKMDRFRLPTGKEDEPLVFTSLSVHPALEEGCEVCHTVGDGELGTRDLKEACYSCHENFEEAEGAQYVHSPVADGECTSCHDPHFSPLPKLAKSENVCIECHDAPSDEGTVHYPVKTGECVSCHGPHVGAAPKQLVRPGNALCLGCHEDPHPRHRSAEAKGTMTVVPEDFPKEKGELSCLGCHFPHESAERRLFRMSQGEMCKMCHKV